MQKYVDVRQNTTLRPPAAMARRARPWSSWGWGIPPRHWWRSLSAPVFNTAHRMAIRRAIVTVGRICKRRWQSAVNVPRRWRLVASRASCRATVCFSAKKYNLTLRYSAGCATGLLRFRRMTNELETRSKYTYTTGVVKTVSIWLTISRPTIV